MEVFILLSSDGRITDFSFSGDTAIVTTAAAAIFGEQIIGVSIREVLDFTYEDIRAMLGTDVSPKRRMAACLGLLATRNAIHEYLEDGIKDDFSDVLE